MSNSLPYKECQDCKECKNAALARLKDAIALLNAGRYMGTLYMVGYVIEIGVKSELFRLAETEISSDKMGKEILDYLSDVAWTKPKTETVKKQRRQQLEQLLGKIFRSSKGPIVSKTLKAFLSDANLPEEFSEIPASWVIIYNEYPRNPKKSKSPNTPPKSKAHNIGDFLDELSGWKNLFKETPPDNNQYFDLKKRYKFDFDWDTKLRYSFDNDQILAQNAVKAKKAVETSIDFLKDVLGLKNEIKELMKKPISNKD
jgi:HEPN domain-containing protein